LRHGVSIRRKSRFFVPTLSDEKTSVLTTMPLIAQKGQSRAKKKREVSRIHASIGQTAFPSMSANRPRHVSPASRSC
jgi:hypothetical protein